RLSAEVEPIRNAKNRAELADNVLLQSGKLAERQMLRTGVRFAMIARDVGNQVQLRRIKRARAGALDQIVRMLVMLGVRDEQPDIMKHGCGVEHFGIAIGKSMQFTKLLEQADCEFGH